MGARGRKINGVRYLAALLALTVMVFLPKELRADDALRGIQEQVQALGGPEKADMDIKRRVSALEREANVPDESLEFEEKERIRTHIKMDGGVPFPKAHEAILPEPASETTAEGANEAWAPPDYRKPERCDSDDTTREQIPHLDTIDQEFVLLDSLYVREGFAPVDAAEIYGKKTEVHVYAPVDSPGVFIRVREDNVPCLPYRIRVTNKYVYRDRGDNALKNYDTDPSLRGKLHPWVGNKLEGKRR